MAAQPPPNPPNRSVDLKAAAASAAATTSSSDLQTDGGNITKMASTMAMAARGGMLPPNVKIGLPPINPAQFNQYAYVPQFHHQHVHTGGSNIFNISNSHNVQIGRTNIMNVGMTRGQYMAESSSDDEDEEQTSAIEDSRIQELRRCEREISNIELQDIAQHVGLGWRRLIRFMGLQDYDVDEVYEEFGSRGLEEVIYQLFKRWKCEVPNPTVAEMLYQIERCDMFHLAQHLRGDDFMVLD